MFIYLFSYLSIIGSYFTTKNIQKIYIYTILIYLIIFIGLRENVGGDWDAYLNMHHTVNNDFKYYSTYDALFGATDVSYAFLNIVSYYLNWNIYFVNLICASIFIIGSWQLCKLTKLPIFSLSIIIPYLGFVVAMGYTRQSAAIGLVFFGISYLIKNDYKKFVFFILAATSFHFSAIISLLFLFKNLNIKKVILYSILSLPLAYFIVLRVISSSDSIIDSYTSDNLSSQGAFVRLGINFLISLLFIIYYFGSKQFKRFNSDLNGFFLLLSAISILLFLLQFKFSTIADRFGLYFCCVQPLVLSQIARFYHANQKAIFIAIISVLYLCTLIVWLKFSFYAQNFWIPYDNIIFDLI